MPTQTSNVFAFHWRSWLGLAVALLLMYGAFNVFSAVAVPVSLHLNGAGAVGGTLVLSQTADSALLGRSLAEVDKADPRLGAFLVSFMDTMCAYMMAFALLQLGVVWFALRRGTRVGAVDCGHRRSGDFPVPRGDYPDLRALWRSTG
jgi:hypothetical protein